MDTCILELGTRLLRLTRARVAPSGRVETLDLESERLMIGASVDATGGLGPNALAETLAAVGELLDVARTRCRGTELYAVAPHALGEARNAGALVDAIERRYGLSVALLTPRDTARLAYRAAHAELGGIDGQVALVHLGDAAIDFASGTRATVDFAETRPIGVARLHRAFGGGEGGLSAAEAGALFSVVRLCAGPAGRRLRGWGAGTFVVTSATAGAVRDIARAWGYLDEDRDAICRVALHALVPEILGASPSDLASLGVDPVQACLVGTAAVAIDALSDLLGQREVFLCSCGAAEGAALELLARPALRLASGS